MSNPMQIGLGAVILVLAAVIVLVVLPIANESIQAYAAGPDGVEGGTGAADDPPGSQVSLLELFPLTIIAALVIGGVAFLVAGFKSVQTS